MIITVTIINFSVFELRYMLSVNYRSVLSLACLASVASCGLPAKVKKADQWKRKEEMEEKGGVKVGEKTRKERKKRNKFFKKTEKRSE